MAFTNVRAFVRLHQRCARETKIPNGGDGGQRATASIRELVSVHIQDMVSDCCCHGKPLTSQTSREGQENMVGDVKRLGTKEAYSDGMPRLLCITSGSTCDHRVA